MTCASAMLSNYKAPYTATVVDRLFKRGMHLYMSFLYQTTYFSGGCLIGKANMDEFAMGSSNVDSHFGPVKHPRTPSNQFYDDFYVAGGSSGGCAVAIKEFMCDL
jgi:aspartyl-tRNA(Asn)/glutamyl-tRNA(Gln) amidotransferase subunit A